MGAEVTIHDIDMAHRVPTREAHGGPNQLFANSLDDWHKIR